MNINYLWLAFILGYVISNLSPKKSWKWISIVYDLHLSWAMLNVISVQKNLGNEYKLCMTCIYLGLSLICFPACHDTIMGGPGPHSWTVRIRTMKYIEHDDWSPIWLSMPTSNTVDDCVTLVHLSVCYIHNHKTKLYINPSLTTLFIAYICTKPLVYHDCSFNSMFHFFSIMIFV